MPRQHPLAPADARRDRAAGHARSRGDLFMRLPLDAMQNNHLAIPRRQAIDRRVQTRHFVGSGSLRRWSVLERHACCLPFMSLANQPRAADICGDVARHPIKPSRHRRMAAQITRTACQGEEDCLHGIVEVAGRRVAQSRPADLRYLHHGKIREGNHAGCAKLPLTAISRCAFVPRLRQPQGWTPNSG